MLKNRHDFIKKIIIIMLLFILKNNNYYIYDYEFIYFLKGNLINELNKYHINYIIIDNMKIIKKIMFNDNKYNYYKIRFMIYRKITNQ